MAVVTSDSGAAVLRGVIWPPPQWQRSGVKSPNNLKQVVTLILLYGTETHFLTQNESKYRILSQNLEKIPGCYFQTPMAGGLHPSAFPSIFDAVLTLPAPTNELLMLTTLQIQLQRLMTKNTHHHEIRKWATEHQIRRQTYSGSEKATRLLFRLFHWRTSFDDIPLDSN